MDYPPVSVTVCGDYALFTREFRVERVTYPCMTPSAARGVMEAIFWKPEFSWRVREIAVLKPIRYFSILRNEISTRQSKRTARDWENSGGGYFANEDRAQRHSLVLKDVAYVIRADVHLKPHATESEAAYRDQFRRRLHRGQCLSQPYLGCREFSCHFRPTTEEDRPLARLNMDLGKMLFDLHYDPSGNSPNQPIFFDARLEEGVLRVDPTLYEMRAAL